MGSSLSLPTSDSQLSTTNLLTYSIAVELQATSPLKSPKSQKDKKLAQFVIFFQLASSSISFSQNTNYSQEGNSTKSTKTTAE